MRRPLILTLLALLLPALAWGQTPPPLPMPGNWGIVSCNTLQQVLWKDGSGQTITRVKGGSVSDENYFGAWNGGAWDPTTNKLTIAAQGGDNDGADNGIYGFDLITCLWSMVFGPTVDLIPSTAQQSGTFAYCDAAGAYGPAGKCYPQSRHTYGGSCSMPGAGTFLASGVAWHLYNIVQADIAKIWHALIPGGWQGPFDSSQGYSEIWCAWDSKRNNRVLFQNADRLRQYLPGNAVGNRVFGADDGSQPSDTRNRFFTGAFDPDKDRMIGAGVTGSGVPTLEGFSFATTPAHRQTFLSPAPWPAWTTAPGIAYDPIDKKYWVYPNAGNQLHVVDSTDFTSTVITGGGVNPGSPGTPYAGTWKRFEYLPAQDVFVLALKPTGPVYAFKPVRGGGGGSPPTYHLTLGKTGTGDGSMSGTGDYTAGTAVALGATPAVGSTFDGWDCSNPLIMPAAPTTCTATFSVIQYALTVAKTGTGSGDVGGGGTYAPGTVVTLTATPNAGSVLSGWDCPNPYTTPSSNSTCTATFTTSSAPTYTLTIVMAGTGTGTVTGGGSYVAGASVSMSATPTGGSTVVGWSAGCPIATMPANDVTCTVTFDAPPAPTPPDVNITIKSGLYYCLNGVCGVAP
jgi:hypothetical protein